MVKSETKTVIANNHKNYIDSLKGIACFMVMFGHFLGILRYAENFPANNTITNFFKSNFSFFLNESFWLYLFFIVSGYLLAMSPCRDLKSVLTKSIKRFFRLGIPILFAYIIIFVIYKTIGFRNGETISLFNNAWYQNAYDGSYTVLDVLISPFDVLILRKTKMNTPYWVLREMFFSSIYIYVYSFIRTKLPKKTIVLCLLDVIALCITYPSKITFSCFFGVIAAYYEPQIKKIFNKSKLIPLTILLVFSLCYMVKGRIYFILPLFASLLLSAQEITTFFDKSKLLNYIGKISFGIYSFHWPIICSAGAFMLIALSGKIGVSGAYAITIVTCIVLSVIFAIIYNLTAERAATVLTNKIMGIFKKNNKRTSK